MVGAFLAHWVVVLNDRRLNKTTDNGEKQEAAILMDILRGLGEEQTEKQIFAAPAARYLLQFLPARIKLS